MNKFNFKISILFSLVLSILGFGFAFMNSQFKVAEVLAQQTQVLEEEKVNFSDDEIDFNNYTPETASSEYSRYDAAASTGTIYNNVFIFSLDDADSDSSLEFDDDLLEDRTFYSGDLDSALEEKFNTNAYSLKNYMYEASNAKLNFESDIYKGTGAQIAELPNSFLYYQPYYVRKNGTWVTNPEGYFEYHLVKSSSYASSGYSYSSIANYELIANVYLDGTLGTAMDSYYKGVPKDTDPSDKILCYSAAKALASANSNYYLVEAGFRNLREYRLINDVYKAYSSMFNSEGKDTDGSADYLDSVTFSLCLSDEELQYDIVWSELLWAHKWNLTWLPSTGAGFYNYSWGSNKTQFQANYPGYLQNLGYTQEESFAITDYIVSYGTDVDGIRIGTFNLVTDDLIAKSNFDVSSQTSYNTYVQDNATLCHELSHVLGLPDLYLGSGNTSAVGAWSHMCSSHNSSYSFHTSYERKSLGWLDTTNNVKKITKSGEYTLDVVKGLDGTNTVAYYVENTEYPSQKFYFEYRNRDVQTTFDKNAGEPGLLIYRVNTSYDGNHSSDTLEDGVLEIYVCRKYNYDNGDGTTTTDSVIGKATFTTGETFGSLTSGLAANINDMAYMTKSKTYVSAGIRVTVTETTAETLTFRIDSSLLEETPYTADDFESVELYNKLKAQSDALGNEILSLSSFTITDTLDISGVGLQSTSFFSMFDLSNIKYLNCANNLLDANDMIEMYTSNRIPPLAVRIVMAGNMIDLSYLDMLALYDSSILSKVDWGFQKPSAQTSYINQQVKINYYTQTNDCVSIEIWSKTTGSYALEFACGTSGKGSFTLVYPKNYLIKMIWKSGNPFGNSGSIDFEYTMMEFSTRYNSTANALQIMRGGEFPDVDNLVTFISYGETFEKEFILAESVSTLTTGDFDVLVNLINKTTSTIVGSIDVYYSVTEKPMPTVELPEASPRTVEKNSTYEEYGIIVYESGTYVPYTQSTSGGAKTYSFSYYVAVYSNGEYTKGEQVSAIDTSVIRSYLVSYTIVDSTGEVWEDIATLVVHVTDIVISRNEFDAIIYEELLKISGKTVICEDDFINVGYFDLSSLGLNSVKGLNKINYKNNVVINFADNNFSDTSVLNELLNDKSEISTLLLIKNDFNLTDKQNFDANNQSKVVFGFQNGIQEVHYLTNHDAVNIEILSDFANYFEILNVENANITTNNISITGYGDFTFTFAMKEIDTKSYSFDVKVVRVLTETQTPLMTKSYNESFIYDVSQMYEILGTSVSEFEIVNNSSNFELDKIGEYTITYSINLVNSTITLNQFEAKVKVVDNIAPVITLNGDLIIYISNASQLDEYYNQSYSAYDEYQGNIEVDVTKPNLDSFGTYYITYTATDESGNEDVKTKTVYYGNVTCDETTQVVAKDSPYELQLTFEVFEQSQFNITYSLNNSEFLTWAQAITISNIGNSTLKIKLVHNINSDIVYNFEKILTVKDLTAPVLNLKGQTNLTLYAGQSWSESGWTVTDDSVEGQFSNNVTTPAIEVVVTYKFVSPNGQEQMFNAFTSNNVGIMEVIYTATDASANSTQKSRTINFIYAPVESVSIVNVEDYLRFEQGEKATFTAVASGTYKVSPDINIIWVLNGKKLDTVDKTIEIDFLESGDYSLKAQVVTSSGTVIESQVVHVTIIHTPEYTNAVLYVALGVGGVCVLGLGVFFINKFRKRNFY